MINLRDDENLNGKNYSRARERSWMRPVDQACFEKKGLPMMDSPTISSAGMFNKLSLRLSRRGK